MSEGKSSEISARRMKRPRPRQATPQITHSVGVVPQSLHPDVTALLSRPDDLITYNQTEETVPSDDLSKQNKPPEPTQDPMPIPPPQKVPNDVTTAAD